MRLATLVLVLAPLALAVLVLTLWGAAALWFRLPAPEAVRAGVAACYLALGLATLAALFGRRRLRWLAAFAATVAALLLWWTALVPPAEGDWAPELARQVTGEIDGDTLRLRDVRAFEWRTATDATEAWVEREYDLATLATTDLFMSYWAGPAMAHVIVSFGFADGRHLAWSIEVRRSAEGAFSPLADFFRANPIIFVAAEERDVIGLRTNVRGDEQVYLFRVALPPGSARRLLAEYVATSNRLAERPAWFNSVFTNCSFTILRMARAVGIEMPLDWRVFVNGYSPGYLYDLGALNRSHSLADLYAAGLVNPRARAAGLGEAYSTAIRDGVPPAP